MKVYYLHCHIRGVGHCRYVGYEPSTDTWFHSNDMRLAVALTEAECQREIKKLWMTGKAFDMWAVKCAPEDNSHLTEAMRKVLNLTSAEPTK